ncbi:MAG: aminotransferase class V-fold PLP-dependent enzyme, partial [Shewanella sp.]
IAPYAIAAHSIHYFVNMGSQAMRDHNLQLMAPVVQALDNELVSPRELDKRSGTLILQFGERQAQMMAALAEANISVDARSLGIRISPHIYNDKADILRLLEVIKAHR